MKPIEKRPRIMARVAFFSSGQGDYTPDIENIHCGPFYEESHSSPGKALSS